MEKSHHLRLALLLAALPALPATYGADWKLEAGLTAKETYTDNVDLSAANRNSDFITELAPYVTLSKKGARLEADFSYRMRNLFYADESSRSRTFHQLAARAKAELYQEELFLDATATISQQITSLLGPIGADTATTAGNVTNVSQITLSPYWQHRFGPTANGLLRYTHSEVRSGNGVSDSTVDGVQVALTSGSAFRGVSWGLHHSSQSIDYRSRPDVRFSTTYGTLGYRIQPRLQLTATAGYDDNNYVPLAGKKAAGSFWQVGATWNPTSRSELSAFTGERYFGKTYGLKLDHRMRRTNWHAGYSRDVTTFTSQFTVPATLSTAAFLDALYQASIPDPTARAQFVATLISLLNLPATLSDPLHILSQLVYLQKRFDASVAFSTAKTTTVLSYYDLSREALESGTTAGSLIAGGPFASTNTIKQRGVNFGVSWRLSPRLTATGSASFTRNRFTVLNRTDNLKVFNLGLARSFNPQLTGSLNLRHQQRDSDVAGADFRENAVIGTLNYQF
ncbi:TIGR03016 family PEP-CTERM system-associated outer membrane protein [Thiobacter aerophilum]|uniref:TIGR03016 family PEP-CTERM system-associated outer membrane protein n=1 Tax=Thiobacter aerophilum TaxID=3121275 RepID=A0ABV0EH64_9BURK